jgi:aryl-alcohol dehydrogenase-like predicted oxidoreductase
MNFGPHATEAESFAIMDRAVEAGIDFFDTANVYGKRIGEGLTERIVGRWFALGNRRDRVVIATKAYGKMGDGANDARLSALHLRRAVEESLRRLQTDRIDLFQFHHYWREVTWDEVWQALETLVAQGKVIYVGSSNFAGWHIAKAQEAARARGFLGLVSEQSLYNLTERTVELEVLPACRDYGLGLIPWSPLAEGLLAGSEGRSANGRRAGESVRRRGDELRPRLDSFERFAASRGESPANLALAWLLHQPGVTAPILGPRTLDHLEGALGALEIRLTAEDLKRLDEIFPGPGGPAPEAYAW